MKRFLLIFVIIFLTLQIVNAEEVNTYQTVNDSANLYYAQNDIDNAFQTILTIPEESRNAQNWLLMGNVLHDKGKNDDAIFMYNRAIQVDANYYKAYYNLGIVHLENNQPNTAVSDFQNVIKLKKDYPYAHYNLACAYIMIGDLKKARKELLNAIALKNTVPEFHYNLAYVYKQMKNDKNAKVYLGFYNKLEAENQ